MRESIHSIIEKEPWRYVRQGSFILLRQDFGDEVTLMVS